MAKSTTPSKRYPGVYSYDTTRGEKRWGAVVDLGRDYRTNRRRQERQEGMRTQAEAVAWQAERRDARRSGQLIVPSDELLGAYLERWVTGQAATLRPATVYAYRQILARLKVLEHTPLDQLRPAAIEAAEQELLQKGYRATTVRAAHHVLSSALGDAVRLELLSRNPCDVVDPPRGKSRIPTTWGSPEMRAFLAETATDGAWGPVWAVLCECWLRVGELVELRWGDVDLAGRAITVSRTATRDAEGRPGTGPVKTTAGGRVIPISDGLAATLRRHRSTMATDALRRGAPQRMEGFVFPGPGGRRLSRTGVAHALERACKAAGLPVLSPHELRHSGGSIAHAAGADIKVISERLGHSSITTTLKIYVHTRPDGHRRLADQLASLVGTNGADPEPESKAL